MEGKAAKPYRGDEVEKHFIELLWRLKETNR